MPLALLLSPDDQAVSAITAVLEEMSVTCERPLDGVAAAKQLNSHNFDLVIVDCENLPAAKLIFDVCRRGTGGKNPIPIAIVNGRAGLPTAFRLGADLILTKPVAKDQARSTIRGAVNRVKKEQPASADQAAQQLDAVQTDAGNAGVGSPEAQPSYGAPSSSTAQIPAESHALAAAASAKGQGLHEAAAVSPAASAAPMMSTAASAISEPDSASAAKRTTVAEGSTAETTRQFSDDPVLAELEQTEAGTEGSSPAPVFSAYQENEGKQSKTRGPLLALVALSLLCGGLYAVWMTQPGLRTLVQPQVEKVLSLVGMAPHTQTPAPAPVQVKPAAPPVPAPAPVGPVGSAPSAEPGTTDGIGRSADPTAATGTTPQVTPSSPVSNTAAQTQGIGASAANGTMASPAATNHVNKSDGDKTVAAPNPASRKSADNKNASSAVSANAETSADKAVVLSSTGAEKRLIHSVPPTYPASVRSGGAEGPVLLKAVIDEDGKVSSAQVVQGNAALADSAVKAVKQWRYRPYIRDGKVVPFETVVQIDFPRP
ncbi:MAG: TonB family protein [Terriglobales bacterium]